MEYELLEKIDITSSSINDSPKSKQNSLDEFSLLQSQQTGKKQRTGIGNQTQFMRHEEQSLYSVTDRKKITLSTDL